jgi:hypothetical protein
MKKHWMDGLIMQNETEEDFELVPGPNCELCNDTGEIVNDEYDRSGQMIGPKTLIEICVCRKKR